MPRAKIILAPEGKERVSPFSYMDESRSQPASGGLNKTDRPSFFDSVITGVIVLIFGFTPLFFTGLSAQGIGFDKLVLFYFLVLAGILAWSGKIFLAGELKWRRTFLDLPILALMIILAISTFFSVGLKDSLIGAYGSMAKSMAAIATYGAFYYFLANNLNIKRLKLAFGSLVVSGMVIAAYSILQFFGIYIIPADITKTNSFNPIGTLRNLSIYLLAIVPFLATVISQADKLNPRSGKDNNFILKVLSGIGIATIFFVLIVINGFTPWYLGMIGIGIILAFLLPRISAGAANASLALVVPFIAFAVLTFIGAFSLFSISFPSEVGLSRNMSWEIAKKSLKDTPWLGSGPSTYYHAFDLYKGSGLNETEFWNINFDSATGSLFEFLPTVGILGTLGIIILELFLLVYLISAVLKTKDSELQAILLSLFAGFAVMLVGSFLFAFGATLILALVIIGALSAAAVNIADDGKFFTLSFKASQGNAMAFSLFLIIIGTGAIVLLVYGGRMYLADCYNAKALTTGKLEDKINYINKARAYAPYQDNYCVSAANYYSLLANDNAGKDSQNAQGAIALAIDSAKKAVFLSPNNASNQEVLALVYENAFYYVKDSLKWAEEIYDQAAKLKPASPWPSLRIGLIQMAKAGATADQEDKKNYLLQAIKSYDEALRYKTNLVSAYYGKSSAYETMGNSDEAIASMTRAVELNPSNQDYRFELGRLYYNRGSSSNDIEPTDNDKFKDKETDDQDTDDLSVSAEKSTEKTVKMNNDLKSAETLFLSVLKDNNNYVNARYSLALLYQKAGDKEKSGIMVRSLLETLTDDKQKEMVKKQFEGLY